jgi:hypothetical protein
MKAHIQMTNKLYYYGPNGLLAVDAAHKNKELN